VAFALVPTVVTDRSKPDELDGAVRSSFDFNIRRRQIAAETISSADVDQDAVLSEDGHTSTSVERSWLLVGGTTGDRVVFRPWSRWSGHGHPPMVMALKTRSATDFGTLNV